MANDKTHNSELEDGHGNVAKLIWSAKPFGRGGSRMVFKGKIVKGKFWGFKGGDEVVLKAIMAEPFNRGVRITEQDIAAQKKTSDIIAEFNATGCVNKSLYSTVGALTTSAEDFKGPEGQTYITEDEELIVEKLISGEYEKFNSNTGWTFPGYDLPNFLSHWSWVNSGGKHFLCDLQGHRSVNSDRYYWFTDPVIISDENGKYGCADLGPEGMVKWFSHHKCNRLCIQAGIEDEKPATGENSAYVALKSTTYEPTE